jgi:hypothetical protein
MAFASHWQIVIGRQRRPAPGVDAINAAAPVMGNATQFGGFRRRHPDDGAPAARERSPSRIFSISKRQEEALVEQAVAAAPQGGGSAQIKESGYVRR